MTQQCSCIPVGTFRRNQLGTNARAATLTFDVMHFYEHEHLSCKANRSLQQWPQQPYQTLLRQLLVLSAARLCLYRMAFTLTAITSQRSPGFMYGLKQVSVGGEFFCRGVTGNTLSGRSEWPCDLPCNTTANGCASTRPGVVGTLEPRSLCISKPSGASSGRYFNQANAQGGIYLWQWRRCISRSKCQQEQMAYSRLDAPWTIWRQDLCVIKLIDATGKEIEWSSGKQAYK
jgi:hypothetical protein